MDFDVIIIGGGPAGLACATITAKSGLKTIVFEKKTKIGSKVCAGGITWNGLISRLSGDIAERSFSEQFIHSSFQKICIQSSHPIIATVNRRRLGQEMAAAARQAGAEVFEGWQVKIIGDGQLVACQRSTGLSRTFHSRYLVGADGSSSLVRRYLKVPAILKGIGVNYLIKGEYKNMEWHLSPTHFNNGYGWIFPHLGSASIGGYVDSRVMSALNLKENIVAWAGSRGIDLTGLRAQADMINFDYRGYRFGNIFLAGDAAGLASALTGEGIYPAIVSGEHIGRVIAGHVTDLKNFKRLLRNHRRHQLLTTFSGKSNLLAVPLMELLILGLRNKLIDFSSAEMAR